MSLDSFFNKRGATSTSTTGPQHKQARAGPKVAVWEAASHGILPADPKTIITWNANGLSPRVKDYDDVAAFLESHQPDVICLQEVRLRAAAASARDIPDGKDVASVVKPTQRRLADLLRGPFSGYHHLWSLHDQKKSGVAIFVHRSLGPVTHVAASFGEALRLHGVTDKWIAEADLLHRDERHHPEGRFIYTSFASFDLLNTYVPNRGWFPPSINARAVFDRCMQTFLRERAKLTSRPVVWCGDLNVAHSPLDSTDEGFFRAEEPRDCGPHDLQSWRVTVDNADRGIPGFSDNERRRFSACLAAGDLVDVWRKVHPGPAPDRASPAFTWRGASARPGTAMRARYEAKAQRLDTFCASQSFVDSRVAECAILGEGINRKGFLGSDHCPVKLALKAPPHAEGPPAAAEHQQSPRITRSDASPSAIEPSCPVGTEVCLHSAPGVAHR